MSHEHSDKSWTQTSASFAPAMLGAAAGIFLGDLMHRNNRRPVALIIAALGAAALAPRTLESVADKLNGPNSRRGNRRTLRNIRDAGINADQFPDLEDEISDQMLAG